MELQADERRHDGWVGVVSPPYDARYNRLHINNAFSAKETEETMDSLHTFSSVKPFSYLWRTRWHLRKAGHCHAHHQNHQHYTTVSHHFLICYISITIRFSCRCTQLSPFLHHLYYYSFYTMFFQLQIQHIALHDHYLWLFSCEHIVPQLALYLKQVDGMIF